jgi:hypothetical protein
MFCSMHALVFLSPTATFSISFPPFISCVFVRVYISVCVSPCAAYSLSTRPFVYICVCVLCLCAYFPLSCVLECVIGGVGVCIYKHVSPYISRCMCAYFYLCASVYAHVV